MSDQFLMTAIGGLLLYLIIKLVVRAPGLMLQSKFKKLGNMTGLSKQEIINTTGNFQSIRHLDDGSSICVWQAAGYIITMQFDKNQKFVKVLSETAVR